MKKYLLLILIFCTTISLAQNLIENGNFETKNLSGWSGYNNQNVEDDLTKSRIGGIINGDGSLYQTINVNAGETYIVHFNYRWVIGEGNYDLIVRVKEEDTAGRPNLDLVNGTSTDGFKLDTTPDKWFNNNTFSFTVPSGISKIRLLFYKAKDNRPLRIDNISLINSNSTTRNFVDENSPRNAQPQGTVPGDWTLDFSDEFNDSNLNLAKWYKSVSTRSRAPRMDKGINDWRWISENAFLNNNGALVLRATKINNSAMRCGSVESRGLYETKYGYLEARIKIAKTAKGNHTAFWLQGKNQGNVDNSAADGAEVDIFESAWTTNTSKAVVHYDGYGASKKNHTIPFNTPNIHNDEFHTYGLLWTETEMYIYYDGKQVKSNNSSKPFPFSTNPTNGQDLVPNVKQWLWLSVGASFGDGDFQSQPVGLLSDAVVDYVRVYKPVSALSVHDNLHKNEESLQIYPNPINDFLTIISQESSINITVFDVKGKRILHHKATSNQTQLDFSGFVKGVYFIQIKQKDKITFKKVVF
tara:strand:+ start:76695 stop:78275 length:1581 start_codon:yes stop_codon:yes gene_type:complete